MVLNMGIVLLPEMTGNQIQVNVSTPAGLSREESYAEADKVIEALLTIDGVDEVGVMDSSSASNMMGGMLGQSGGGSYGSYVFYIALPEGTSSSEVERITEEINQVGKTLSSTVGAAAGGVDDLTAMLGSGLSVKIYGDDLDTLETLANEISQLVQQVEGYTKISTSFSGGEPTIQLVIDVHRDAIATGNTYYKTAAEVDGQQTAQLMFVTGTDAGGLTHDHWQDNLAFQAQLHDRLNSTYPGIMRPMSIRASRFNQHIRKGSMLVEVGACGNTLEEALAAAQIFANTLADALLEQ
jgi:hypothetical protein